MDTLIIIYALMFFFGIYFLLTFVLLYFKHKNKLNDSPGITEEYSLSIIVPCYNAEKNISRTIENLLEVNYKKLQKIVVVDDCSTDNSYKIIKKYADKYAKLILVKTPKNTGCAAGAKNYGAKFVNTELIGFTDDDSLPEKDAVNRMIGFFDDKKVVAVTSRVLVKNKENFMEHFQDIDYEVIAWSRKIMDFIDCVYVTNGPLSIYRRTTFEKVGGFDPKNMTEDIELTWNLLSKGYKTKMAYTARVFTVVPDNLRIWINQRIRWNVGGLQTLFKYRKFFLKNTGNLFGFFVINYVFLSFALALFGLILFSRFLYLRFSPYIYSLPYFFKGYNPFLFFDFYLLLTVLLIWGIFFFVLSLLFHKLALKNSGLRKKSFLTIVIYSFVYRPLYIVPFILTAYKLLRRDIRWYTK